MATTKLVSFNCKCVRRSIECIRRLCCTADIIALQETWLLPHDIPFLGTINDSFSFTGKSAVDTSAGILRGRPYGGVALLWRKAVFPAVSVIQCNSVRLIAIKIVDQDRSILVFSVYMPTDSNDNLPEFTDCLSEMCSIIENNNIETVYILGDFNAHPGELFSNELRDFCCEQSWSCIDMDMLSSDAFTFVSDAYGCRRWLDHCLVTSAARASVRAVTVLYDTYFSDHYPLQIECDINRICQKTITVTHNSVCSTIVWGDRSSNQIELYTNLCNTKLRDLDFPQEFHSCADKMCNDDSHKLILRNLYLDIVNILSEAATSSYINKHDKRRSVPGWNKYVSEAHREARLCFQMWLWYGKPKTGRIYHEMCESRKIFKSKLKFCQDNEQQIKMNIIAEQHKNKQFGKFWKSTKKLNPRLGLPVSVSGLHDPHDIANAFQQSFKVDPPPVPPAVSQMLETGAQGDKVKLRFHAKEISDVISNMSRGKSPGHDSLSIEHLKYAGIHLPRVLALFVNLSLSHSYLPEELMRTLVVPIIKNKTGDPSDLSNYRPISLATIIAKVLDSLLDKQLEKNIHLHDAQFGFRPNLSTESAIYCLKQTVHYYTARNTPVYACYLDLSKAFDLVNYDVLWSKLHNVEGLPSEFIWLLKYWYSNQENTVRWAGTLSEVYRLQCGVRQGGLSSPRLFNLYINGLIEELSGTGFGCSIDGTCINNISYADDMVLLSPSVRALRSLLNICEAYSEAHGLRYNAKKSEFMIFKAGKKQYRAPVITLCGTPLQQVSKFKYLGHWVTDDSSDNMDIERERRALSVRCNMLARRFARCTRDVKITLFKSYCQTLYTCGLWVNYTHRAYSALRVQYNNTFRGMLGLPRWCSASAMFAEARTQDFFAVMRMRCASLLCRIRISSNVLLKTLSERWDSPMLQAWMGLHSLCNRR